MYTYENILKSVNNVSSYCPSDSQYFCKNMFQQKSNSIINNYFVTSTWKINKTQTQDLLNRFESNKLYINVNIQCLRLELQKCNQAIDFQVPAIKLLLFFCSRHIYCCKQSFSCKQHILHRYVISLCIHDMNLATYVS